MEKGTAEEIEILTEVSGVVEPGKRTFDDPASEELFPLVRLDFL